MLGLGLAGKICSIIFFSAAAWFYIPPKTVETNKSIEPKDDISMVKVNGHH